MRKLTISAAAFAIVTGVALSSSAFAAPATPSPLISNSSTVVQQAAMTKKEMMMMKKKKMMMMKKKGMM